MKKTILALTIPALFATSVSAVEIYSDEEGSKIDLYGRLQYDMGAMDYQSNGKADNFGGEGEARLGVNVQYGLNQDVDLIGKYEAQIASESSQDNTVKTRYSWLGFRFQDTTDLTFGKSEAPRALLTDLTDT
ncbi:MAG: porin, partial [Aeromonadales bacterium]|nr:porin [Aeromonadales bacterium]